MFIIETEKKPSRNLDQMVLRFRLRQVPDEERSRLEGREVMRSAEFCRIHPPGDKQTIIDVECDDEIRAHPRYLAWKNGRTFGTPLTEFERTADPERIDALAGAGVFCVEDLAATADINLRGDYTLRKAAQDFLAQRAAEQATRVQDERDARIASQAAEIAELKAQVAALIAKGEE